jgi:hypothetical protein
MPGIISDRTDYWINSRDKFTMRTLKSECPLPCGMARGPGDDAVTTHLHIGIYLSLTNFFRQLVLHQVNACLKSVIAPSRAENEGDRLYSGGITDPTPSSSTFCC